MVLLGPDGHGAGIEEGVIDAEATRQSSAVGCSRAVDAKLTSRLGDTSIVYRGRSRRRKKRKRRQREMHLVALLVTIKPWGTRETAQSDTCIISLFLHNIHARDDLPKSAILGLKFQRLVQMNTANLSDLRVPCRYGDVDAGKPCDR